MISPLCLLLCDHAYRCALVGRPFDCSRDVRSSVLGQVDSGKFELDVMMLLRTFPRMVISYQ